LKGLRQKPAGALSYGESCFRRATDIARRLGAKIGARPGEPSPVQGAMSLGRIVIAPACAWIAVSVSIG